jgi:hypothetical protein
MYTWNTYMLYSWINTLIPVLSLVEYFGGLHLTFPLPSYHCNAHNSNRQTWYSVTLLLVYQYPTLTITYVFNPNSKPNLITPRIWLHHLFSTTFFSQQSRNDDDHRVRARLKAQDRKTRLTFSAGGTLCWMFHSENTWILRRTRSGSVEFEPSGR